MELNDAARRIVRQHWLLILCLVALGIGAAAIHARTPSTYTASTRLVLGTDDPKSRTESGSIADTAKAIATSVTQVRLALVEARVRDRDAIELAKRYVNVRALGTSAVVQLTVRDRSPTVAAAIANALAERLIKVRGDVAGGQVDEVLTDLATGIDDLSRRISETDRKIDQLNVEIASTSSPTTANALRAKRDEAARVRDFMAQQRSVLESERIGVLSADALRPKAAIISAAAPPSNPDASRQVQEIVLGALLGLVLGVGIAALIETFRPTLVGSDAVSREFDTPLLGVLPADVDEERGRHALGRIAMRVRLAADSIGAETVGLVGLGPDVDLGLLAATLDELARGVRTPHAQPDLAAVEAVAVGRPRSLTTRPAEESLHGSAPGASTDRFRIRRFGLTEGSPEARSMALALVAPDVVKKAEIADVSHLLRVAGRPLVGLIAHERPRARRPRRRLWPSSR